MHVHSVMLVFFFNDTATTEIYTLSLHDALPIYANQVWEVEEAIERMERLKAFDPWWIEEPTSPDDVLGHARIAQRSEEHTSELQSRQYLVCRLLLEKKK